jgi:hypothetical protein
MRNLILIGGLALATAAPSSPPARARVIRGDCKEVFGASVCVWARLSGDQVVAFGATLPYRLIADAPANGKMVWPPPVAATIRLPADVREATGFDNFQLSWEHHGHPPGAYLAPHFDFHFYTEAADRVSAIDCSNAAKPAQLPLGYALPDVTVPGLGELKGICVPTMGMHALPEADLTAQDPFSRSMLVGYYGGAPIFLEPMISRATLMRRRSFEQPVPMVPGTTKGVRYPVTFQAVYDKATDSYDLVLGMTK